MASHRQTNFSSGELSPFNWGRTDLPIHARGLRTCKNFFISKEGPAVSRPGTSEVRQVGASLIGIRLVPFVVSDSDSYVCEFGYHYIRFHRLGRTLLDDGTLSTTPTSGTPYEVVTDYGDIGGEVDIAEMHFAQVGDQLTIVAPGFPPKVLTRTSATTFALSTLDFVVPSPNFVDIEVTGNLTVPPRLVNDGTLFVFDADHAPREWEYYVSETRQELATGKVYETLASKIVTSYDGVTIGAGTALPVAAKIVLFPDRPVIIRRYQTGSPNPTAATYTVLGYNYYRGRDRLRGFIGTSKGLDFVDVGATPDYNVQPLAGTAPFGQNGSDYETPVTVGYFQEKRVFGGTDFRPTSIITSATGNFNDYDKHILPVAGQALEFELASRYRERIRWLVGQRHLLAGTDVSVWAISGTDSDILDYDSVYARIIDNVGCTTLRPLVIGPTTIYVRAKGRGVRAITAGDGASFNAQDISHHARHLFVGGEVPYTGQPAEPLAYGHTRQVIDWAYAEDPWGVIWAVRDDGVLLSCTISPNGEVAWARHETDGFVIGVCSIPETGEDGVYIVVSRNGERQDADYHIERMTSRVENDSPEDRACVDSCIRFNGVPTDTITGLDHLEGKDVWAVSWGNTPYGPLTVTGGSITLPEVPTANNYDSVLGATITMFIGLAYTCDLETLDFVGGSNGRLRQKALSALGFEVDMAAGVNVGQDFDHLDEWEQRDVADSYGAVPPATTVVKVAVESTFNFFGRACLRQTLPLPCTVLGIVREIDTGD